MQAQVSCHLSYRCVVDLWAMFTKYVPGTHTVSVYIHVLTLDVCMEERVLWLHFLTINTQSNRTKTTVKVSSEAVAQASDGRVLPYHVRGTGIKTQLSLCFCCCCCCCWSHFFLSSENDAKTHFFQKTNYQAT